jgi:hypothetical protein
VAETLIRAGAVLDTPSSAEVRGYIREAWRDQEDARELELARGVKWMRKGVSNPGTASTLKISGPDPGFTWRLNLLTVTLTAADSVTVYIGDAVTNRLVGYAPSVTGQTVYVLTGLEKELLYDSEGLYVATTGTGDFTQHYLSAWQVPAEQLWKLL